MRLTHLLLTCCLLISTSLVVAQEEASAASAVISTIPSSVIGGGIFHDDSSIKINKEIEIEAKDIIVNIGKVDIEIEREKQKRRSDLELATVEDDHHIKHDDDGNKIKINKEIEIEAKDIIVNIGKVKVEIEKEKRKQHTTKKPTHKPTWKPTHKPHVSSGEGEDPSEPSTTMDELPLFEDFTPAAEPDLSDEVVLGENSTAITVQGGEHQDERGVLILTGPQIFSVTFKIVKEKVITITGSDFNTATDMKKRKQREAVTFIIRGRGFVPGGNLFNQIDDVVGGTSRGGMFSILEPQVFLGAIPLKVVRFTDTTILARFLDREDQRNFEPGTLLARVKVLHVDIKKEKKKHHGPGEDIGILGEEDAISGIGGITLVPNGFSAVLAALNQPSLFTRTTTDGLITSPVLGVIDNPLNEREKDDHDDAHQDASGTSSLLGLFSGLRFDTAVLAVQFSEKDAQKIRGAFSTLLSDELGVPDI